MQTNLVENRQIRIFISSTFRDMQAERDYLVNKVFPSLKKYCAERDVTLKELDLRWGITEEESKHGKVVEICLQEIENTHPFFIGLLGQRYGWAPTPQEINLNEEITDKYPWLIRDISAGLGITEIEMQYGVLRSKEDINAYFYLRSPEMPVPEDFYEDKEELIIKLDQLKKQIRSQEKYPVRDYASIEELGRQVEADFKRLVDTLFPEGSLSEIEKERLQHKAFLKSRTGVYISNPDNDKCIDDFMADDSPALVITGESGMGKSALIANWIAANEKELNRKLIYHFVGNSGLEGDYRKTTQRLINEIGLTYGLSDKEEEPEALNNKPLANSDKQKEELEKLLLSIVGKEPLLIILDGINQLADYDNAKLLNWLPSFPTNVKVLYSTLMGDPTMEVFKRMEYPVFTLDPLDSGKREELIHAYLGSYRKSLLSAQIKRIASDKECENTLVLRTLLDELRVFGVYEEIDKRIEDYLSASDIHYFFDKVLARIESSYNFDDTNFVGEAFALIAVSRSGLSETELLKLTSTPPLYWSQLYNALSSHLTVKNGLITFSHAFLREAVVQRYLSLGKEATYRDRIVAYCEEELQNERSHRIYDEFPYQLHQLRRYDRLYSFLLDFDVFNYISTKDLYELGAYWRGLIEEDNGKYRLEAYLKLRTDRKQKNELYNLIGNFINDLFRYDLLSLEYYLKTLTIRERILGSNNPATAISYNNIGVTYMYMSDYPKALEYYFKALDINERVLESDNPYTAGSYNNIGVTYRSMGNYPKALEYHFKALDIEERVLSSNNPDTATSYNNIGGTYGYMGDYPKALEYFLKALNIFERISGTNNPDTATSYNNIGSTYGSMGDYPKALEYHFKALDIEERVLGTDHPATAGSYNSIGSTYGSMSNYPKALEYTFKALDIQKRILGTDHPDIATSYNNIGSAYGYMGNYPKALEYKFKALDIRERFLGTDHPATAVSYNNIGDTYDSMGDYPKALEYFFKALDIKERVLGTNNPDTADSYNNIGGTYDSMGDYPKALEYKFKTLDIQERVLGTNNPATADSYNNIGSTYYSMGDYPKALEYTFKALDIRERVLGTDHPDTAGSYNNIGGTYYSMGDYPKALEYTFKALDIQERVLGADNPGTATSYNNIGSTYNSMGDYPKALEYHFKALTIRERILGLEHPDTADSYNNIGVTYYSMGDYPKALEYFFKAYNIYEQVFGQEHPSTINTYKNIAHIYNLIENNGGSRSNVKGWWSKISLSLQNFRIRFQKEKGKLY